MKREFLINVVLVVGLNILIKVFFIFGIDVTVQNLVGATAYGAYFAMLNLAYLFQIINDFGIQNFNNKHIAQHRQLLPKYLPNILVFKMILGLAFMLFFLFFGWYLGYWEVSRWVLLAIGLNQILVALIYYLRSNISALGHYRVDSIFSVMDKFLMILIIGSMLWVPSLRKNFNMEWFAWGQFGGLLLTAMASIIYLRGQIKIPRIRLNVPFLLVIIKESGPYALLGLLMAIYGRVDSVLLAQMVSDHETGIYASAFRLMDAGAMFGLLISAFLLPMFVRAIKEKEPVGELAEFVIKLMWVVGLSIVIPVVMYRFRVMTSLYHEADAYSADVLGVLMITLLALLWSSVNGVLLLATGAINRLNILYFVTVLLNLGLNYTLIPRYGALGAAAVAATSQWLVTLVQYGMMAQYGLLNQSLKLVGQIVGLPVVGVLAAYGVQQIGWPWVTSFVLTGILVMAISVALGLFSPKGLIKLLKNR